MTNTFRIFDNTAKNVGTTLLGTGVFAMFISVLHLVIA